MGIRHWYPQPPWTMGFFNALRRFFRHIYVRLFGKAAYYINGSDTLPPPLKEEEEERQKKEQETEEEDSEREIAGA